MKPHKCRQYLGSDCACSSQLPRWGPNEHCPVHGNIPWPPKCDVCGRFVSLTDTPSPVTESPEGTSSRKKDVA